MTITSGLSYTYANVVTGSSHGDGAHFTVLPPGTITFKPSAHLSTGAPCLNHISCDVLPAEDITNSEQPTWMRKIRLHYPSSGTATVASSTVFPLNALVFDNATKRQRWLTRDNGQAYPDPNVSDYPVGIPGEVFMAIWNGVNRSINQAEGREWEGLAQVDEQRSNFVIDDLAHNDGHYWLYAKAYEHYLKTNADASPGNVPVSQWLATTRESMQCDACVTFYLMRFGAENVDGKGVARDKKWVLRMTTWHIDQVRRTAHSRPAAPSTVSGAKQASTLLGSSKDNKGASTLPGEPEDEEERGLEGSFVKLDLDADVKNGLVAV